MLEKVAQLEVTRQGKNAFSISCWELGLWGALFSRGLSGKGWINFVVTYFWSGTLPRFA